jgi:hypothetical protein
MWALATGASATAAAINGMLSVNDFTSCPSVRLLETGVG